MKKKLSILLAVAMVLSLLPAMNVLAETENSINRVPAVGKNYDFLMADFHTNASGTLKGNNTYTPAPYLMIKPKDGTIIRPTDSIRLTLTNAEWRLQFWYEEEVLYTRGSAGGTATYPGALHHPDPHSSGKAMFTMPPLSTPLTAFPAAPTPAGYNMVQETPAIVTIYPTTNVGPATVQALYIPLWAKVDGAGEAKVSIGENNYGVSTGTYTFANAGEGMTKITPGVSKNFTDRLELESIIIDEIIPGTIKDGIISITAPPGFHWELQCTLGHVKFSGHNINYGATLSSPNFAQQLDYGKYAGNDDKEVLELRIGSAVPGVILGSATSPGVGFAVKQTTTDLGTLTFSNLVLIAEDEDAKKGDVNIKIKGAGITEESVKVGVYVDYDTNIEAEDKDLPVLVSGVYTARSDDDDIKTLKATFKENAVLSWHASRRTNFVLPDGVKFRAAEIKGGNMANSGATYTLTTNADRSDDTLSNAAGNGNWSIEEDKLTSRNVDIDTDEKGEVEITCYVSIEPNFEGDITLTATGDGVANDSSAVIAKAISPFTVETSATDAGIGSKNVPVGTITIKETQAGAIGKAGTNTYPQTADAGAGGVSSAYSANLNRSEDSLVIAVEEMSIDKDSAKVEVTDGDMQIEKIYYGSSFIGTSTNSSNNTLKITVKRESDTASTIRISDMTISLDRTLPYGAYELRIGGVVAANFSDLSKLVEGTFDKSYYVVKDNYVEVSTPPTDEIGSTFGKTVKVTIGEKTLQVGEDTIEMDVEAYIEGGYTMIPVRFVAVAIGLREEDVVYNANDKSVMIYNGAKIAKMTVGSKELIINGTPVAIDAAPVIKNNRTFLPFRVLGEQILGVTVDWDETSRTATFN